MQFVESFQKSDRCGAATPGGAEVYLLPQCPLSARLCASAFLACDERHKRSIPGNIGEWDLMLAVVQPRSKGDQTRARALTARLQKDKTWSEKRKRCGPDSTLELFAMMHNV
jgi:hypothetical protein